MSLVDLIQPSVSQFHIEKLNQIAQFDYSKVIKQVSKDFNGVLTRTYLNEGIENLKKYYAVALLDPFNQHAVSRHVDPFWHAHILHTEEYIAFCETVYQQYVQHEPLDEENHIKVAEIAGLYDYTLKVYHQLFKHVDSNWWPARYAGNDLKGPTVCKHQEIHSELIRKNALFPEQSMATH